MTATSGIGNLGAVSYAVSSYRANRISLPVSPSSFIYSQFKHVRGTPAPEGSRGVSVTKLKVLDVLVDQLIKLKQNPDTRAIKAAGQSDERLDALINQYREQIQSAQAAHTAMPYRPAPSIAAGALFSLSA